MLPPIFALSKVVSPNPFELLETANSIEGFVAETLNDWSITTLDPPKFSSMESSVAAPIARLGSAAAVRAVESSTTLTSAHVVGWGASTLGCRYNAPNVTVTCGAGGTITLISHDILIKSCEVSSNRDSLVCSREVPYTEQATVIVVCSGTEASHLTATMKLPASQAEECRFVLPTNSSIKGGIALLDGFLTRSCKDSSGVVSTSASFSTCLSGTKRDPPGNCVSTKKCFTDQSSCSIPLDEIVISDFDSGTSCVNVGPNLATVPISFHTLSWGSRSTTCRLSDEAVVIRCENDGEIMINEKNEGVADCVQDGSSAFRCSKRGDSAIVNFECRGRGFGQLEAYVEFPKATATDCNSTKTNKAYQALGLYRICSTSATDLTNKKSFPSDSCGTASQLVRGSGTIAPVCVAQSECTGEGCTVDLETVTVRDPAKTDLCTFFKN
jgi:hypothetical protein